jgi:hypothetical protein
MFSHQTSSAEANQPSEQRADTRAWWYVPWISWVSDFFDPLIPSPKLIW